MSRSALFVLMAVVLTVSPFGTGAMAAEHETMASLASGGHMGNFVNWLQGIFGNYGGYQNGTVPVPGTLLAFAAGFVGFAAWRAKRSQG